MYVGSSDKTVKEVLNETIHTVLNLTSFQLQEELQQGVHEGLAVKFTEDNPYESIDKSAPTYSENDAT